ncbi:hypothetical protein CXK91_21700 [Stutzerimonas stutzeri]|uniref:Uncharacterized protein n=1 Tax=Stutzerimonas stutzeri TaxID=316 RepID=A0A2S4AHK1_STUST|nr:hypothetical protein [Stutzerimonas stutzeri]MCQ4265126.1 hypothetical protein [Stutzerimonas stutzeri]POH80933.1 hypothetical protein CXK91_21700 [Stutzerimonas stutzeri]
MNMEQPEQRKWDQVTPEGLYTIIQYLKSNFDAELSHKVIELFHERMRDDIDFDPALLHSLMKHVFAQIMEGKSADQAFGLKTEKGKYPRPDTHSRDLHATAIVILRLRQGLNLEDSSNDAAELLGISDMTVKRACADWREALEELDLPDETLQVLAAEHPISP